MLLRARTNCNGSHCAMWGPVRIKAAWPTVDPYRDLRQRLAWKSIKHVWDLPGREDDEEWQKSFKDLVDKRWKPATERRVSAFAFDLAGEITGTGWTSMEWSIWSVAHTGDPTAPPDQLKSKKAYGKRRRPVHNNDGGNVLHTWVLTPRFDSPAIACGFDAGFWYQSKKARFWEPRYLEMAISKGLEWRKLSEPTPDGETGLLWGVRDWLWKIIREYNRDGPWQHCMGMASGSWEPTMGEAPGGKVHSQVVDINPKHRPERRWFWDFEHGVTLDEFKKMSSRRYSGEDTPDRSKTVIQDDVQMKGFKSDDDQVFRAPRAKYASLLGKMTGRFKIKWIGQDRTSHWTWARFPCSRGAANWPEVKMSLFTDPFRWIYRGRELRGRWHSTLEYERIRRAVEWLASILRNGRQGDSWFGSVFDRLETIAKRYGLKDVRTIDRERENVKKMLRHFSAEQIKVIDNYFREELILEMRSRGEWPAYPQDLRTYPQRAEEAPERKNIAQLFEVHIETVDQWFEEIEARVLSIEARGEPTAPAPFYFGVMVKPYGTKGGLNG